jgi:hypothetical protein
MEGERAAVGGKVPKESDDTGSEQWIGQVLYFWRR